MQLKHDKNVELFLGFVVNVSFVLGDTFALAIP